jgi:trk system potassium uptake protein TrkH
MTLRNIKSIQKTLGLLLTVFSGTMLTPIAVALIYQEPTSLIFVASFAISGFFGLVLWLPAKNADTEIRLHEGFIIVASFWVVLALFGALPFFLLPELGLSFTNAVFESTSGLTTTGATILTGLDELPRSLLFYRQQLQWLGGLGIVVLAVALLPILGVGGMRLYRVESSSAIRGSKFTPRQKETAKALASIYLVLTALCVLCYKLAGMNFFDALSHGFSTIAIGGFSTHDASLGFYHDSPYVYRVAVIFMFLAGVNFSLHFFAWKNKNVVSYFKNTEFKTYCYLLILVFFIAAASIAFSNNGIKESTTITEIIFQVVSIGTTTGFTTSAYDTWPFFVPFMLLLLSFVGGCVGSTGGGLKVVRVLLLYKQGAREIKRLIHPSAEVPVILNGRSVDQKILDSVWGFIAAYLAILVIMVCMLVASGLDVLTSFSAITASLNNLGPGLGDVFSNYAALGTFPKWVCITGMVLGRLEIFALLVLFTRAFWRE